MTSGNFDIEVGEVLLSKDTHLKINDADYADKLRQCVRRINMPECEELESRISELEAQVANLKQEVLQLRSHMPWNPIINLPVKG